MKVAVGYAGDYVDATYGNSAGITRTFERIIALPPERSDNSGRIRRIREFAAVRFGENKALDVLDVGAGLGVFPYTVKQAGWNCTSIDPDQRAVDHMRERVGVTALCGDFMAIAAPGRFDLVTFNKVLEHVGDPISMLRRAREFLAPQGCVYLEVPDGEMAAREGGEREEFTIEHLHVFSFVSTVIMAQLAGYSPLTVERVREPSTKFTLRAFLAPAEIGT
jgi:SAM-dependent methyltransferase